MNAPVQIAPIQTTLQGCDIEVQKADDGGRVIFLIHPSAQIFVIPLDASSAKQLSHDLYSAIEIANVAPRSNGNG